ncbi:hypothetical protein PLEOSDRAFT_1043589 [Pleurotus ostreatus PC15]|uniref:Glycoside hydrolase family 16 protein n=1 Tax=Pleurotus ostreatus (strain PC15) TaxID=1137138 RepID=A0A067NFA9_PLEO1|nr:hypothetical protein PLEOSDRAFT_1043589 [Pleurotus ostreatus PC15]
MLLSRILGILILCSQTTATKNSSRRNVTIDDQFGDEMTQVVPTYMPPNRWNKGGMNLPAAVLARPNASLAHGKTWHDSTHLVGGPTTTVNFGFTGVSIYVYCIIVNMPPGPSFNTFANYKFSMDGNIVGEYTHEAERTPDYLYNTPVYVNTSLDNAYHNFSIIMDSTKRSVLILFDYAVYTMM